VTDPQPTKDSRPRRTDALARTVGSVIGQVDKVAGHVERVSEDVVHRATAKVESRRGGAYAASIIRWLRDGIVFMLRDWRLVLLQVPSAVGVSFVLYRLRVRALGTQEIVSMSPWSFTALAVLSVALFLLVFTCSTVFVVALKRTPPGGRADLPSAWAETRVRWRWLLLASFASGLLVGGLFAFARNFERLGYTVIGLIAVGVLVGLVAVVPLRVASAAPRKQPRTSRVARVRGMAIGSSASLIMEAPTVGMAEVGRLFTKVPGLRIFGYAAVVIGGLLHMAAQSSTRAFKFTSKFLGGDDPKTDEPKAEETTAVEARTDDTKADETDRADEGGADPSAPAPGGSANGLGGLDPVAGPADQELDDEQQHRRDDQGDDRSSCAET
jgi:hypothetical protein